MDPERARPRPGPRAPTIIEVAAAAGVSKSTVSNVVRGASGVSAPTRARVEAAIARLGYRPNVLARQLVQQRSSMLGVVFGDLSNLFYAEMATRIERAALELGYTAMFCNVEGTDDGGERGVETLLEHRVAGVIFLAVIGRSDAVRARMGEVPVVFAGLRERWGDSVAVDDELGARLATEHLIGLGHRRIAFATASTVEPRTARARLAGYERSMAAAGLEPRPAIAWDPDTAWARAGRARVRMADVLLGPDAPTALFCSSDYGAIALLELADHLGVAVPGRLSVVGFDNVGIARLARISLTTIAQPLDALAREAVETLVGRLTGRLQERRARHVVVDPRLVVRATTARPARPSRARRTAREASAARTS